MFWSRPIVSDEMKSWITECFDWFDDRFEPPTEPILPTKAFFKAPTGSSAATAALVLEDLKRHMKFDGHVEIVPLNVLPAEYRIDYQSLSSVAGTYQEIDGVSVIQYDPEHMNRPTQFINLLAHELMHARLSGLEGEVPGGEPAHELATDLGCIVAGFGVFQLQAADDAGWFGYMTQPSRAFALAMFLNRRGLSIDDVSPYLASRCRKLVIKGFKEL